MLSTLLREAHCSDKWGSPLMQEHFILEHQGLPATEVLVIIIDGSNGTTLVQRVFLTCPCSVPEAGRGFVFVFVF